MNIIKRILENRDDTPWESWQGNEKPILEYHIQGDTIWIDMFYIHSKHQRKGVGEKLWKHFEASIPPKFHTIKLVAADTGEGPSEGFWEKMGFEVEDEDDPKYGTIMIKKNPASQT